MNKFWVEIPDSNPSAKEKGNMWGWNDAGGDGMAPDDDGMASDDDGMAPDAVKSLPDEGMIYDLELRCCIL